MAVDYEAVTQLAREYASDVKAAMPVSRAVLFGSHAKGIATAQSDIDICFFLDDFGGKRRVDIITNLFRLTRKWKCIDIQPIAFETSDLYTGNPFVNEVIKTGVDIL